MIKLTNGTSPLTLPSFCADPSWSHNCETSVEHNWLFSDTPKPSETKEESMLTTGVIAWGRVVAAWGVPFQILQPEAESCS